MSDPQTSGPTLFLIGAPRAGTTQLAHWLASHPLMGLSPIKEPNFFSAHEFDPAYVAASHLNDVDPARSTARGHPRPAQFAVFRDEAQYRSLFASLDVPWRIDASTTYLSCPEAPAAIARFAPDARILLLTRDPVARAISHYRLAQRTGRSRAPLGDELQAELSGKVPLAARYLIRPSQQAAGVARFRAVFPAHQRLELRFEAMVTDPAATLARIAAWLGIAPDFNLGVTAQNASAAPRFPALNAALHRTGAKTALRAILPKPLKQSLKHIWFNASAPPPITGAERAALIRALT